MLEAARGLSAQALDAIADLEARTVAVDGGRLKLEWGSLRSRSGDDVEDLLWWDGDQLLGFAGIYSFGAPTAEIAGMVDPAARRRGIATTLLDAARARCRERGYRPVLLVTPRSTPTGALFALARGGSLEHSEHALVLHEIAHDGPADPRVSLRRADLADAPEIARLIEAGFGHAPQDMSQLLESDTAQTLLIEFEGRTVGTLRVSRDASSAGVYGFAVDPAWQGRGIGRDVLRRVCRELLDEGRSRVGLEVAVDNEHALGLYTSLGFVRTTTEDYFSVPVDPAP